MQTKKDFGSVHYIENGVSNNIFEAREKKEKMMM